MTVTRRQAEAALAAVKAQFVKEITPTDWTGHTHETFTSDADLLRHLGDAHHYTGEAIARRLTKGQTLAGIHDEDHKPEAMYPEPTLIEDTDGSYGYQAGWAIVWEEGPYEWPYVVGTDEATEEERILVANARAEFGHPVGDVTKSGRKPAVMPKGVWVEAINHYSIGVYPA